MAKFHRIQQVGNLVSDQVSNLLDPVEFGHYQKKPTLQQHFYDMDHSSCMQFLRYLYVQVHNVQNYISNTFSVALL